MHANDFEAIVPVINFRIAETAMSTRNIKVWDRFVRIFHWSLVGLFTLAYFTGDDAGTIHVWSGYAIVALIASRIVWGFIGSKHARFSDFVRGPSAVFRYLKALATGNAARTLGHNPAGGWMVLLLLASILATAGSGLVVLGLEGEGPMAGHIATDGWIVTVGNAVGGEEGKGENGRKHEDEDDDDGHERRDTGAASMSSAGSGMVAAGNQPFESAEDGWEEIHEWLANLTVLLVILHVAGVILSSIAHRENLVRAMVTGVKQE
jgi:cytochrome b